MEARIVVCFRWHDPDTESVRYLAAAERIWRRVAEVGGESLSWSSDRYSFGFDASAVRVTLKIVISLLSEAKTHAAGISLRPLLTDQTGRSWGPALVCAEALAGAASPGEILLDPSIPEVQADKLATLGTIPVRVGAERVSGALLLPGTCSEDGFRSSIPPDSFASDRLSLEDLEAVMSVHPNPVVRGSLQPGALGERAPRKPTTHKFEDAKGGRRMSQVPSIPAPLSKNGAPPSSFSSSEASMRRPGRITAAGAFLDDRERPSVLSALRSGDAPSLLRKAAELRNRDVESPVAESLEGLALIVRGDAQEGVRALRECALRSEQHSGPNRVRARLALAVGYSLSGDRFEAVMAGLGALARARECGDTRGEIASVQLLANLSRGDGQNDVSATWAGAAPK